MYRAYPTRVRQPFVAQGMCLFPATIKKGVLYDIGQVGYA